MSTSRSVLAGRSLGTYLAVTTTVILLTALSILFAELTSHERKRVLSARRSAAEMATSLFAANASAALTFDDREALEREVSDAIMTRGIHGAGLFASGSDVAVARAGDHERCSASLTDFAIDETHMVVRSRVLDASRQTIGDACMVFSLDEENRVLEETRRGMFLRGAIATAVIAALLMLIARQRVVRPLAALVDAARAIERGERRTVPRVTTGTDELARLGDAFDTMSAAVADRERRLLDELDVAARLQVSILPRDLAAPGLEIAAKMVTATEVGGDYYDVIPVPDGCFIGIGDVSGHGLGAGIIALMIQSAVSALVRETPDVSPRELACVVNRVLYENVRTRMERNDHATLTLLRYTRDGRLRLAGAHEDIFVRRAKGGGVEAIETPGTWVGAVSAIESVTEEVETRLAPGDVVVLYTDGITEAMRGREQFGPERVRDVLAKQAEDASVLDIRDAILDAARAWSAGDVADDMSILVIRHLG